MEIKFPQVNYIGNKQKITSWIVDSLPISSGSVLDLFAGGSSVAFELKKRGFKVIANDALYSSYVINKALIENKEDQLESSNIDKAMEQDINNNLRNEMEWLDNNLFYPEEVDELSKLVDYSLKLKGNKKFLFQALIRRAMIRKLPYSRMNLDWKNITKLRDEEYSYKKYKRRRAYHNQSFYHHMNKSLESYNMAVFDNQHSNIATQLEGINAIKKHGHVDLIYVDPPYPGTMNKYYDFYGAFDTLFDKKVEHTDITHSKCFLVYLEKIADEASKRSEYLALSLNSNSKPGLNEIVNLFSFFGDVSVLEKKHNYQVSGKTNKHTNLELLMIVKFYK